MPRQPFSKQKSGQKHKSLRECIQELNRISGGDILSLLLTFFTSNKQGKEIFSQVEASTFKHKYDKLINNIMHQYKKTTKTKFKSKLLSLVSDLSNKELKHNYHFPVSTKKLAKIRAGVTNKKPGKKPVAQATKDSIVKFVLEHSQPAANQTVKMKNAEGKKIITPVQVISSSVRNLYGQWFSETHDTPLEASESTFRNNIPKNIKKARKATDLCEHCEKYEGILREQKRIKLSPERTVAEKQQWEELEQLRVCVEEHKDRNTAQRTAFKEACASLKDHEALLLMDFKENLKLGGCPREVSSVFYTKFQMTVFGCIIITRHKWYYHDFLSEDLTHDSCFVVNALSTLFNSSHWKSLNITSLTVWSDGGPHFRNHHVINFHKQNFDTKLVKALEVNYFIEYHGKSHCDSHFSKISSIVSEYETGTGVIKNLDHLHTVLTQGFAQHKETDSILQMTHSKHETGSSLHFPPLMLTQKFTFISWKFLPDLTEFKNTVWLTSSCITPFCSQQQEYMARL